jgi:regulatory protein
VVITKIEKQKKSRNRWNIYIDGEFACGVYEDTLAKYGLAVDDEVSGETVSEIKEFDEYLFAKKAAYDFLSYRIRSTSEIIEKLTSKKVSAGTIERVVEHLKNLGLVNDEAFTRELVQSKLGSKPVGKRVIKQKLFQKGIPGSLGDKVLEEMYSGDSEKEMALLTFKKYLPKVTNLDKIKKKKKLFYHLIRKGFDIDTVKLIINENLGD